MEPSLEIETALAASAPTVDAEKNDQAIVTSLLPAKITDIVVGEVGGPLFNSIVSMWADNYEMAMHHEKDLVIDRIMAQLSEEGCRFLDKVKNTTGDPEQLSTYVPADRVKVKNKIKRAVVKAVRAKTAARSKNSPLPYWKASVREGNGAGQLQPILPRVAKHAALPSLVEAGSAEDNEPWSWKQVSPDTVPLTEFLHKTFVLDGGEAGDSTPGAAAGSHGQRLLLPHMDSEPEEAHPDDSKMPAPALAFNINGAFSIDMAEDGQAPVGGTTDQLLLLSPPDMHRAEAVDTEISRLEMDHFSNLLFADPPPRPAGDSSLEPHIKERMNLLVEQARSLLATETAIQDQLQAILSDTNEL